MLRAAPLIVLGAAGAAAANPSPFGVWIDDTGRGGIEISDCGGKLCGKLVWFRDSKESSNCGKQLLGDVAPAGRGKWDSGWIYSPEKKRRFDVEITPLSASRLQVMGYMGVKFLSKTMVWTRAPANLARCDKAKIETAKAATGEPQAADRRSAAKGAPPSSPPPREEAKGAKEEARNRGGAMAAPAPPPSHPAPPTPAPEPAPKTAAVTPSSNANGKAAPPPASPPVPEPSAPAKAGPGAGEGPADEKEQTGGTRPRGGDAVAEADPGVEAGPDSDPSAREDENGDAEAPGSRKKGSCTLEVPYVTITFPCDK